MPPAPARLNSDRYLHSPLFPPKPRRPNPPDIDQPRLCDADAESVCARRGCAISGPGAASSTRFACPVRSSFGQTAYQPGPFQDELLLPARASNSPAFRDGAADAPKSSVPASAAPAEFIGGIYAPPRRRPACLCAGENRGAVPSLRRLSPRRAASRAELISLRDGRERRMNIVARNVPALRRPGARIGIVPQCNDRRERRFHAGNVPARSARRSRRGPRSRATASGDNRTTKNYPPAFVPFFYFRSPTAPEAAPRFQRCPPRGPGMFRPRCRFARPLTVCNAPKCSCGLRHS